MACKRKEGPEIDESLQEVIELVHFWVNNSIHSLEILEEAKVMFVYSVISITVG